MSNSVFAVVVTFFPDRQVAESLVSIRSQVAHMVVVDNGSPHTSVQALRDLAADYEFDLIENEKNYGIGAALNKGILFGRERFSCTMVMLFDQDSFISADFVEVMLKSYHECSDSVFLVLPAMIHRRTGRPLQQPTFRGKLLVGQTSGSLLPLSIFSSGLFREDLFIEYVDYEFCLRSALLGKTIALCPEACLYHEPGKLKEYSLFGIWRFVTFNSSPIRKYYSMRNALWMIANYGTRFPRWALFTGWNLLHEVVGALVFEEDRLQKLRYWFLAVRDAALGRLGEQGHAVAAEKP